MQDVIGSVIALEWKMFDGVQNINGRASCQDDPHTFEIMRRSQFEAWSAPMLESYLLDLNEAEQRGENLVAYKYGYMMAYSDPDEFEGIRHMLPEVEEEKKKLVRDLTDRQLELHLALGDKYPHLLKQGRPARMSDENQWDVSLEAYSLGELSTYSLRTLRLFEEHLSALDKDGKNFSEMILSSTVRAYGYPSIDEAERSLSK